MASRGSFKFAIDRGGTFTDVFAKCPDNSVRVMKLLSVDPKYKDAPTEGIRRILESFNGKEYPKDEPIDTSGIDWIRMGTTVATNALLERKGERMGLLISHGFTDVLFIGNQARPKLFDLEIVKPEVLYEQVVEVKGRVIPKKNDCEGEAHWKVVKSNVTDEVMFEVEPLDEDDLRRSLKALFDRGIRSIAVALMHSYVYNQHEIRVEAIATEMGFTHVSLSSNVMPMIRIVPRGFTTSVDTYLTPAIKRYLQGFSAGFANQLDGVNVQFMQSDGGLTPMYFFNGSRAILSGPAGGVVGYAATTFGKETDQAVIGFDMGGTSTDVSRYDGSYQHVFETTTAGVTIQAPQLDISTVAAGGGSILSFRAGLFAAGPDSASAHPGPVCYRKGGPLTITDANLVLGRLIPSYFPQIFGPKENESLDKEAAVQAFEKMAEEVNSFMKTDLSTQEVAQGFIAVANESMCRPIRNLTQGKGYDTRNHVLACFGGAGGQHACAIARSLGMKTVFVHKYAGILSAYGMALADVVHEEQMPCASLEFQPSNFSSLNSSLESLSIKCIQALQKQGFENHLIRTEKFLHMRYQGTDCALMCSAPSVEAFLEAFLKRYKKEFGFTMPNRAVLIDDVRVRGVGCTQFGREDSLAEAPHLSVPKAVETVDVFFDSRYEKTNVYKMEDLSYGHVLGGPCIVMDKLSTILVEPDCSCVVSEQGNLRIDVGQERKERIGTELDTIQLSVFSHRFMSIAEQMGRILQRTSISTNIKERLDFSCALFGPDGGLVSNAPHIPVHLGAMQSTVRYQMTTLGDNLHPGDVILANHPQAGGSHLPDLTVITPVFYDNIDKPVFFVANRGHHADIGGISPGSMPPSSHFLWEEGARFKSFKMVDRGEFREDALIAELNAPGQYPGCSGTRLLADNLSDLKAQIAANQRGIQLVTELIDSYGLEVVQAYMAYIQENAEIAVRQVLKRFGNEALRQTGKSVLQAEDYMDDGSCISLKVCIDQVKGSAVFDFTGTGPEVWGNINAPKAVSHSALIYSLRCLVGEDIPLNQGCLNPVEIVIPPKSILDPSENAAVVGGNVLTSQRIVDVILRAFEACAASQGCCNNITFGDENFGYYETVAGGSGAGPSWNGQSGVHVHMTNTRLTDPEILEKRYPVWLREFHLNLGSGGDGQYKGGDGVVRAIQFLKPLTLSVLTDRRVFPPYGLNGGNPGSKGQNLLLRSEDKVLINLGGKCSVPVKAGDVFILKTPGGGGWGTPVPPPAQNTNEK